VYDSYSCRKEKGTHAASQRLRKFALKESRNNTRTCWVLKCDIRKFFASINQEILLSILSGYIQDEKVMELLGQVIGSFETTTGHGLPLGNLTSQLFVNIYMNVFDQFVKHCLKVKYYVRYADDFVLLNEDRDWLLALIPLMDDFLLTRLGLTMHPQKISLETFASGVDFLGWVEFPHHRVLRTKTKQRMFRRLDQSNSDATLQSYLGLIGHGNTRNLRQDVLNSVWLSDG